MHFENEQWAVTDAGLSSKESGAPYVYDIPASHLVVRSGAGNGKYYDWPAQVMTKNWVDGDAFEAAYRAALKIHAKSLPEPVDENLLEASVKFARDMIASNSKMGIEIDALMKKAH